MASFEVITAGIPASMSEWAAAMRLPAAELPELGEDDAREVARLKLDAETRRRHLQMRRFAAHREEGQGRLLGEALGRMLSDLGSGFSVQSIRRVSGPEGWFVRLVGDSREVQFVVETSEVQRFVIGSVSNRELEFFRQQIAELVEPRQRSRVAS